MESLELLGYITFCWLFLLNARFRAAQVQEWREGGSLTRLNLAYEAVFSLLFGVLIPIALIVSVAQQFLRE